MKKSELLQLAVDEHLAMTQEEYANSKRKFLCLAVSHAGFELRQSIDFITEVRACIEASIGHRATFNDYLANDLRLPAPFPENAFPKDAAKFAFIQFLRKKHAEFLIAQLQAKGE